MTLKLLVRLKTPLFAAIFALSFSACSGVGESNLDRPNLQSTNPTATIAAPIAAPVAAMQWRDFQDISGWFSLRLPAEWQVSDVSNTFARMLSVRDTQEKNTLIVRVQRHESDVRVDERAGLLRAVIGMRFPDAKRLVRHPAQKINDHTLRMAFAYEQTKGAENVAMRGESILQVYGRDFVSIIAYATPASAFEEAKAILGPVLSSLTIHSAALDPTALKIGTLTHYRHPSGLFELDIPINWAISDESSSRQVVVKFYDYAERAGLVLEMTPSNSGKASDLKEALLSTITSRYGTSPGFLAGASLRQANSEAEVMFTYRAVIQHHETAMSGQCVAKLDQGWHVMLCAILPEAAHKQLEGALTSLSIHGPKI